VGSPTFAVILSGRSTRIFLFGMVFSNLAIVIGGLRRRVLARNLLE